MVWFLDFKQNYITWQIKNVLLELIDFCFGGGKQFIKLGKCGGRWKHSEKQISITFSQSSVKVV